MSWNDPYSDRNMEAQGNINRWIRDSTRAAAAAKRAREDARRNPPKPDMPKWFGVCITERDDGGFYVGHGFECPKCWYQTEMQRDRNDPPPPEECPKCHTRLAFEPVEPLHW